LLLETLRVKVHEDGVGGDDDLEVAHADAGEGLEAIELGPEGLLDGVEPVEAIALPGGVVGAGDFSGACEAEAADVDGSLEGVDGGGFFFQDLPLIEAIPGDVDVPAKRWQNHRVVEFTPSEFAFVVAGDGRSSVE